MPAYRDQNFFNAKAPLPGFYWTGTTEMNCLKQCIHQTKQYAYAHHIQRLMVLGNFLLLLGVSPQEANEWYWIVYADAYEWIELPNVTGMILYADGGILATKPYAAGGSYINKMSNYCKSCQYNVAKKTGSDACPFNYLYWNFLIQNKSKLSKNPRLTMMYSVLSKMDPEKIKLILEDSHEFISQLS
jgi:deoxyribodipyrimidine photolyase-related protein